MDAFKNKAMYLRGMADGLGLNDNDRGEKILRQMVSLLDELCGSFDEVRRQQEEMKALIEVLHLDLEQVENIVYDEEEDSEEEDPEEESAPEETPEESECIETCPVIPETEPCGEEAAGIPDAVASSGETEQTAAAEAAPAVSPETEIPSAEASAEPEEIPAEEAPAKDTETETQNAGTEEQFPEKQPSEDQSETAQKELPAQQSEEQSDKTESSAEEKPVQYGNFIEYRCPHCGSCVYFDADSLDSVDSTCPSCGKDLFAEETENTEKPASEQPIQIVVG